MKIKLTIVVETPDNELLKDLQTNSNRLASLFETEIFYSKEQIVEFKYEQLPS